MKRRIVVLVLTLLALTSTALPGSVVSVLATNAYTITDIGPVGGSARAYAMSPDGTVVGEMVEAGGSESVPFVWREGVIEALPLPPGYASGLALGVNDAGTVVGGVRVGGEDYRAVIWTSATPSFVGPVDSLAFAVNGAGVVVGRSLGRAVRWDDGDAVELGSPSDPPGQAEGINEAGDVVGASWPTSEVEPSLWRDGTRTALPLPPGDTWGEAYTISSGGVAAGGTVHDGSSQPVLWDASGAHVLPLPAGWENAVASSTNAAGDVVGSAWGETSGTAVVWHGGVPIELETVVSGATAWDLTETFLIEDVGRIVGVGILDGVERGYLLTPASSTYTFIGFNPPIDNDALNVATAGQVVPLRFQVLSADGTPVADLTTFSLSARSMTCDRGVTADQVEEYWVGSTGLNNLGGGDYIIGWKTPKSYADSCKTLVLVLDDGVEHTAVFGFTH